MILNFNVDGQIKIYSSAKINAFERYEPNTFS